MCVYTSLSNKKVQPDHEKGLHICLYVFFLFGINVIVWICNRRRKRYSEDDDIQIDEEKRHVNDIIVSSKGRICY